MKRLRGCAGVTDFSSSAETKHRAIFPEPNQTKAFFPSGGKIKERHPSFGVPLEKSQPHRRTFMVRLKTIVPGAEEPEPQGHQNIKLRRMGALEFEKTSGLLTRKRKKRTFRGEGDSLGFTLVERSRHTREVRKGPGPAPA